MTAKDAPPHRPRAAPPARLFIALWPGPRVRQALAACGYATRSGRVLSC